MKNEKIIIQDTIVDELGEILAAIKELENQADKIKATIKALGDDCRVEGKLFAASVNHTIRTSLDSASVKKFLTPELLAQCEKVTDVSSVRVVSL